MDEEGRVKFIGLVEEAGELSKVRIFPQFCEGIRGLNEYSHIIVLYWFHLRDREGERQTIRVILRRHPGAPEVGVFASRSPSRPNPIGLCVTELMKIEDCTLTLRDLDALEGSPIVDIKPYLPRADLAPNARVPEWTWQGPPT